MRAGKFVFKTCVKPLFVKRLGVDRSQRWGLVMYVVIYLAVPYVGSLDGTRLPLTVTWSLVLFVASACGNAVRGLKSEISWGYHIFDSASGP